MAYVDGDVVPVPLAKLAAYRRRVMPFDGKRMFRGAFKPMVSLVR